LTLGFSNPRLRHVDFQNRLKSEFAKRQMRNAHYSLRAFARDLGTDHSTLSQILRRRRALSRRMIQRFGARLQLASPIIVDACVQENANAILRLAGSRGFCTHSRWIASRTNLPLDAVNTALHRLLYEGRLVMKSSNFWKTKKSSYV
jgi:hypothetical protein